MNPYSLNHRSIRRRGENQLTNDLDHFLKYTRNFLSIQHENKLTSHGPVPGVLEAGEFQAGLSSGAVLLGGFERVTASPGVCILSSLGQTET